MRWALVFLLVSVLLSQVLAQDSTEDSPAPKRVLKKYRVRRPVVVDDQGNVVRAGPRLRRVRVKQPRPTVETAALQANPPQPVSQSQQSTQPIVLSTNPPRIRPTVAQAPAPQPQPTQPTRSSQFQQQKLRKPEPVFLEDVPQVIEPVRTVPTYRQATPSANRQALLANVNYKSRGGSSAQVLDEEEEDQKVGTIRNYSHINEDGSFTFGYEAADGSFKEETRGIDCVVRGKYGYVDPDGVRREFEYVSGNPCDPNAPKEEEALEDEEEEDERAAPPPRPLLRRVRPEINENNLQGLQQVREEALSDDQLNQFVRPVTRQRVVRPNNPTPRPRIRITTAPPTLPPRTSAPALIIRERPVSVRPLVYQEPSQSLDSDRGSRLFNFDSEVQRLAQISRPISQPQPLYEQPLQVVQRHPTPTVATQPSRQVFGGAAAFRHFNSPSAAPPTAESPSLKSLNAGPTLAPGQKNPNFGRYRTELVYDPSSGQYTSVTVQAMPHSDQEIELTQKLRAFVEPQRPNQLNVQTFGQPQIQYFGTQQQQQQQPQYTPAAPNGQIDQFLARNAYSQQRLQAQQQQGQQQQQHEQQQHHQHLHRQQAQPQQIQNLHYYSQPQTQLRPNPSPSSAPPQLSPLVQQQQQATATQYQFPAASQTLDDGRNPANGQIDAFLRSLNIDV